MREYIHINMYIYIYIYIYTHLYIYTFHMCVCVCLCVCMYVYVYFRPIFTQQERYMQLRGDVVAFSWACRHGMHVYLKYFFHRKVVVCNINLKFVFKLLQNLPSGHKINKLVIILTLSLKLVLEFFFLWLISPVNPEYKIYVLLVTEDQTLAHSYILLSGFITSLASLHYIKAFLHQVAF